MMAFPSPRMEITRLQFVGYVWFGAIAGGVGEYLFPTEHFFWTYSWLAICCGVMLLAGGGPLRHPCSISAPKNGKA
jgi:hypothetical protein